ncbi:mariner Mos1 transposase [Trichonephila clavipes]|nr:mariner Mos1 transposase [Trichonephila clavipes]
MVTQQKLNALEWEVLGHKPYSPDIVPSDYYLFRSLQNYLTEKKFKSFESVSKAVADYFNSKDKNFYKIRIYMLPERWQQVVLAASTARFLQFQRYAATLCQFLIFRIFKSFSTSSIHLVGGLPLVRDPTYVSSGLVVFRASPDVAEPSQSVTSDDLRNNPSTTHIF